MLNGNEDVQIDQAMCSHSKIHIRISISAKKKTLGTSAGVETFCRVLTDVEVCVSCVNQTARMSHLLEG